MEKQKTYKKLPIHALIIVAIILLAAISLKAGFTATHNIDNKTAGGINATLNGATHGDIIELDEGTYTGNNNTNITINKNITIQGKIKDKVILDAKGLSGIFTINSNLNVTFINILFTNAYSDTGAGVYNSYKISMMLFINCSFENNTASGTSPGGVIRNMGDNLTIINCKFINNNAAMTGAIIMVLTL